MMELQERINDSPTLGPINQELHQKHHPPTYPPNLTSILKVKRGLPEAARPILEAKFLLDSASHPFCHPFCICSKEDCESLPWADYPEVQTGGYSSSVAKREDRFNHVIVDELGNWLPKRSQSLARGFFVDELAKKFAFEDSEQEDFGTKKCEPAPTKTDCKPYFAIHSQHEFLGRIVVVSSGKPSIPEKKSVRFPEHVTYFNLHYLDESSRTIENNSTANDLTSDPSARGVPHINN